MNTAQAEVEKPGSAAGKGPAESANTLIKGLARAFGGAILFALPVFMTMEMWELGFYLDRFRLMLLLLVNIPLLVFISHYSGFEETFEWWEDLRDAAIAYGIAIMASAAILGLMGLIGPGMNLSEIVGKIAIQSVPASIGALLGRSQLGGETQQSQGSRRQGYGSELALMAAGALFLGLNVAPTEEMILISYIMTPAHALVLVVLSMLLMHAFVFAAAFRGGSELSPETPWWSAFIRMTVVGYAIALLISAYSLWTFGRGDGMSLQGFVMSVVVLGFPAAIGAAAARLIL